LTTRYLAGRLRSTGQWDDLGLTNNPVAQGPIYSIAYGPDGLIYVGGDFTGLNNTAGAASIDNVAVYNPQTDTWSQVGNAGDLNDIVYVLEFGPDGTLYAGGRFDVAGGAVADYLAEWDGINWATVGVPQAGTAVINQVEALAFGLDGILYVGGTFVNWANIANADHIVSWNGAAYAALGTGMNLTVTGLAIHPNGDLYVVGSFTSAGGVAVRYVAMWDGSWNVVGVGFNNIAYTVAIDARGDVFIGGTFTDLFGGAGGNYNYIARWNLTSFFALGDGTNNNVWKIVIGPDDLIYAGGEFTQAGGITLTDRVAKWNRASWAHLDIDLPGSPIVRGMEVSLPDPTIAQNYDLYLGFSTTGGAFAAGSVTATNNGTAEAYPTIVFERSGGTSAVIYQVRNETTGKEILLDYSLLDGERLTIDLRPTRQSIISNFFGSRPDAILANSDTSDFTLQPGDNQVTSFVNVAGAPTITAWIEWRTAYKSLGD